MKQVADSHRPGSVLLDYLAREWLLASAVAGVLATSLYLRALPRMTPGDLEVLWILAVLFVVVRGLELSGFSARVAFWVERGARVPLKLVLGTFFLSMVVTNDVALMTMVPLTLLLRTRRKGFLVILEALAANAGSALTPFGNPQNLYIYWHYGVAPLAFMAEIAPLSLLFLVLLSLAAWRIPADEVPEQLIQTPQVSAGAWIHGVLLSLVILCILGLLPLVWTLAVIGYALLWDRGSLKIDFGLLATFAAFFLFTDNLGLILRSHLHHPDHVFLFTALGSQLISNVPATLLVSSYTDHWQPLLWGASVGGFGSLVGSMANLIAYRLYLAQAPEEARGFTTAFLAWGFVAFLIGMGLHYLL